MSMKLALADVPANDQAPWVTAFGIEPDEWNVGEDGDGSGLPGQRLIADALRSFASCWGDYDRETAARIFNLPPALIADLDPTHIGTDPEDLHIDDLGQCIQVLTSCREQAGETSVAAAARLTNQHPVRVIEAVAKRYWMVMWGDRDDFAALMIGHDGE